MTAIEYTCARCQCVKPAMKAKSGRFQMPRGWKRHEDDRILCKECMNKAYRILAVTVPIVKPLNGTWQELDEQLRQVWAWSSQLSTWCMARLHSVDPGYKRVGEKVKPQTMPKVNLYKEAETLVRLQGMPGSSKAAITWQCQTKYNKARGDIFYGGRGKGRSDWPKFSYPMPFPVPAQAWSVERRPEGIVVSCRLVDRRWELVLRGGKDFARQTAMIDKLIRGEGMRCELSICGQRATAGDHRRAIETRDNSGGPKRYTRAMIKIVMRVPVAHRVTEGSLRVRTMPNSFLVARVKGRERNGWWLNADHVRGRIAWHRRRMARLAQDYKCELRSQRNGLKELMKMARKKHQRFMSTRLTEAAANLAGYARRQRVAEVIYDDSVQEYFESFPWAEFWDKLAYRLGEYDVTLKSASQVELESEMQELKAFFGDMLAEEEVHDDGSDTNGEHGDEGTAGDTDVSGG